MSDRVSRNFLKSAALLFVCITGTQAITATTGHYTYTISSTSMSVTCNDIGLPCTPTINGAAIAAGDEIAAMDSAGVCIGSAKWTGSTITIPVMGYDGSVSPAVPGLTAGQKITFHIWDSLTATEVTVVGAQYYPLGSPAPTADSIYVVNGIAVLDSLNGFSTPAAPALSAPTTSSVNQPTSITLSWGTLSTASSYGLQVATVSTFASTVYGQSGITANSQQVTGLNNSAKYFWRASATNLKAPGAWSPVWNFTTIIDTPAVPVLASPSNGAVNQLASLTLTWGTVTGAVSYAVQVSTGSAFGSTVVSQAGLTTAKEAVSGLATGTGFYWQVSATNVGGTSAWSTNWSFTTIAIPAAPVTSLPSTGSPDQSTGLVFDWTASPGAASYGFQLSTVATFASTVINQKGLTSATTSATGLAWNTGYYWRVNATNAGGTSAWSDTATLTTIVATPVAPALALPTNAAGNQPTTVTLSWSTVPNAVTYGFEVATASTFASTVYFLPGTMATDTTVSGLANSTKYYWRANAGDVNGNSAWSSVWNFTTIIDTPAVPVLATPSNGAVNQLASLTLTWGTVTGAVSYAVQVSTGSAFGSTVVSQTGLTTAKEAVSGLATGTGYYWQVNATNVGGTSKWSTGWSFTTIAIPAAPVTSSPSAGAIDQPTSLTLSWGSTAGAASYAVQLSTVSTFATTVVSQSALTVTSRVTTGLAYNTGYYWRANATNAGGTSPWSDTAGFTTIVAIPGAVTLSAPTTSSVNQPTALTLSWNSVANAATYGLQVATASTFASTVVSQTGLTATTKAVSGLSWSTKLFWRVSATDTDGTGTWSSVWNFTTIIDTPAVPVLATPSNGAVNQLASLTLTWGTVTGAASYAVQLSTSTAFGSTVVSQAGLTTAKKAVSGLATGTGYYWQVNATNVGGTSAWSTLDSFTTIAIPAAPVTSSPSAGAIDQPTSLTLSWGSTAGAASYAVQLSTVSTFATTVVSQSALTVTSRVTTGLAYNTGYYWRANATNAGGTSPWSDTAGFTTIVAIPAAVTLSAPTISSVNQPTALTLSWNSVANAATYGLQVATASTFASTVISQSGLTATTKAVSGLSWSTKLFWRVSATDTDGTGTWSSVWNFTTIIDTPAVPVLSTPSNGAVNQLAALTLSWGTVTGAASYAVQLSTSTAFGSTVVSQAGLTTAKKAVSGLATGTGYYWQVNATNVGGTSAWSTLDSFTTIAIPAAPVTSSPSAGAIDQPTSLTLSWGSTAGAASYAVQLSTVSTFATTVVSQNALTVTSRVTTGLAYNTGYYWRANATNAGGTSPWSDTAGFTTIVAIPAAVTLSAPTTSSVNQPTALTLSWNSVANAATYGLQVATASTFASTVISQSGLTATTKAVSGLSWSTKLFWRVSATDTDGTGTWSSVWNFTTIIDTPGVPVLAAPSTGANNLQPSLTFSWSTMTGAASYNLQIATSSAFGTTVISQSGITTASRAVSGLANSASFFWEVSATNVGGTSSWSGVWSFTTIIATPGAPVLSSPTSGSAGMPTALTLTWGTVTGASTYAVQLSTVSTFATTVANQPGLTTVTPTLSGLTAGVKYFWRVSATNAGGVSAWSSTWNFTVANGGIVIGFAEEPTLNQGLALVKPTVALEHNVLVYSIYQPCAVGITVTDLKGRTTVLVDEVASPGRYSLMLKRHAAVSGLYIVRFKAQNVDKILKVMLRDQ